MDPDSQRSWIRIQFGSGSTPLILTYRMFFVNFLNFSNFYVLAWLWRTLSTTVFQYQYKPVIAASAPPRLRPALYRTVWRIAAAFRPRTGGSVRSAGSRWPPGVRTGTLKRSRWPLCPRRGCLAVVGGRPPPRPRISRLPSLFIPFTRDGGLPTTKGQPPILSEGVWSRTDRYWRGKENS